MFARNTYTTGSYGSSTTTTNKVNTLNSASTRSTEIIYAIALDDLDTVRQLVNSSNVNNIVDLKNGFTVLHIAISKSSGSDIVKYLLSVGANTETKTKSNVDSYDLAFDHKKRCVFDHAVEQKQNTIDALLVKNDNLNNKVVDLTEKNNYLTKSNEQYGLKLRSETAQVKTSNSEVSKITKLYDEKSNECNTLKRKVGELTEENTKLKRDLSDAESALTNVLKKHKK
jgi:ankyrin repeat protein